MFYGENWRPKKFTLGGGADWRIHFSEVGGINCHLGVCAIVKECDFGRSIGNYRQLFGFNSCVIPFGGKGKINDRFRTVS